MDCTYPRYLSYLWFLWCISHITQLKKAYFVELIAFLIMSTISSCLLVYNFFTYVINSDAVKDEKGLYTVLGSICVSLLILGNISYFISAYFAYNHFELIFMEKFGAKEIYHKIFGWMQYQHSMLKSDIGLIVFLLITTYLYDRDSIALDIVDALFFVAAVNIVVFMRLMIRRENKKFAYMLLGLRIAMEGYKIFRVCTLLKQSEVHLAGFGYICVIGTTIFDELILIFIIISTIKCVNNFGKGFKEMVMKQKEHDKDKVNDILHKRLNPNEL